VIVERMTQAMQQVSRIVSSDDLLRLQKQADAVFVDPALMEYAVRVAAATRDPVSVGEDQVARYVTFGASPRASINMILAAKALALVRGRSYAMPEDVADLVHDVVRHRLVLSYEALADGVTPDEIVDRIVAAIPLPDVPLQEANRP
jgi:MoxR-like ATPase